MQPWIKGLGSDESCASPGYFVQDETSVQVNFCADLQKDLNLAIQVVGTATHVFLPCIHGFCLYALLPRKGLQQKDILVAQVLLDHPGEGNMCIWSRGCLVSSQSCFVLALVLDCLLACLLGWLLTWLPSCYFKSKGRALSAQWLCLSRATTSGHRDRNM